jgi:alkanesulfonate monooxygenase SsuD/methylene tetrahydromethanopterin reductase-like flavin-dependent oxidoreductase (luciferase family)
MANVGLAWVTPAPLTKPENVVNFAKTCEAMGCDSMWTIDRIAYDNLEPLTILAAAAGATQRIRLGTSVLLGNTRHPAHLAKIIATLDYISNGRLPSVSASAVANRTTKPSRFLTSIAAVGQLNRCS